MITALVKCIVQAVVDEKKSQKLAKLKMQNLNCGYSDNQRYFRDVMWQKRGTFLGPKGNFGNSCDVAGYKNSTCFALYAPLLVLISPNNFHVSIHSSLTTFFTFPLLNFSYANSPINRVHVNNTTSPITSSMSVTHTNPQTPIILPFDFS